MPSTHRLPLGMFFLILLTACPFSASGQWSDDPYINLAIADQAGDQVLPLVANTSDGGCYVGWFNHASGNYDVYLQRLDRNGNALWVDGGILVSDYPQSSSLTAWDLICDSGDNAILTFCDTRAGTDLDIYGYKIDGDGNSVWGPAGLTLSSNADYEPSPCVTEAPDGNLIFIWARFLSSAGRIVMQSVTPDGTLLLGANGLNIVSPLQETPGFPDVIAATDNKVIVSWLSDLSTLYSTKHLFAQEFTSLGVPVWPGPVTVFDGPSLPMGYHPRIQSDGAGGALCIYHYSAGNYQSAVQHLDASGAELFPHNGVTVSTLSTMHHISPTLSYCQSTGELYAFWDERNASQSAWGVFGQRFSPTGTRMWGNYGQMLRPTDTLYKFGLRSVPYDDGAMVFYIEETGGYNQERIVGLRVNSDGDLLWSPVPLGVSTYLSGKSRLPITIGESGMVTLIWEDDRNGSIDIYGQNIFPDGSLGPNWAAVGDETAATNSLSLWSGPNPFTNSTRLGFRLSEAGATARFELFDSNGRCVRDFEIVSARAGDQGIDWDGRDRHGRQLPGGIYRCRIQSDTGEAESTKIVLIR